MQVILKKDVQNLGEAGDLVNVKDGYARNFLLPQNAAEVATKGALQNREQNLARIKAKQEKLHQEALELAEKIEKVAELKLSAKAGESGGSVVYPASCGQGCDPAGTGGLWLQLGAVHHPAGRCGGTRRIAGRAQGAGYSLHGLLSPGYPPAGRVSRHAPERCGLSPYN